MKRGFMSPAHLFLPAGFLHVFLYEAGGSSSLGYVDVSNPSPLWNTLTIYPPRSGQTSGEKYMSIYGTSGVSFTVEVTQSSSEIVLNTPKTFKVDSADVMVFQFNPPKGSSETQLDITATSPSNVPAYLKISQIRQDVEENIKVVDYKKESLRLSFAKKGRITLSKVSVPPLTDSTTSWYIGIALKDTKGNESKYVTLELSQSFDYSYAGPICALFFASLVGGVFVSIIALLLFKEHFVISTPNATVIANIGTELQDFPASHQGRNNHDAQKCLKCRKVGRFILAMLKVAYNYWFAGGPKTYSYATGIAGFVLMIGACQFVIADWYIMIQEGDRDSCYYNDFCYRVSDHDIPFNLMMSNLAYIIHALILTLCVWYLETELYLYCKKPENFPSLGTRQGGLPDHVLECPNIGPHILEGGVPGHVIEDDKKEVLRAKVRKMKYSYSIGYAFAWALLFEGLFSTLYHLCPSRLTFQFDSAFMYIIAGLTVLLLYNGIEVNECPSSEKVKYPVGALNFFLYFIVPLFIFNYFGSLYNSESGLSTVLQGLFFAFLLVWWILVVVWAYYKLHIRKGVFSKLEEENPGESYCNVFYFIMGGFVAPLVLFLLYFLSDLSQAFLFTCIVVSVVAVCAKTKILQKLCVFSWKMCTCKCTCERPKCSVTLVKEIAQTCYIVFTTCVLVAAVCIFQLLPTTDKTSSPEESRDLNEECGILGFFDWHDLWHFLSSFALLMGAFVIMFISAEPVRDNVNSRRVCADAAPKNGTEINAN